MSNPSSSSPTGTTAAAPPLHRPGLPGKLAAWCHDRRRLVLLLWIAVL